MKKVVKLFVVSLMLICLFGCSSGKKYHVGVIQLLKHEALDKATQGFVDVLKEEFGDEIDIVVQDANNDVATCATLANGYVADGVDLIMGNATPALQAAARATKKIPVLGTSITDYATALGLTEFTGIIGTNVSGTSDLAPLDAQAQMIVDLFPNAKKIGIIYCSAEANSLYQVKEIEKFFDGSQVEVVRYSFTDSNDIASVAQRACEEAEVIYIPTDNVAASYGQKIGDAAKKNKVPVFCGESGTMEKCNGLASLTIDYYELGRKTGEMAVKILKGEAKVSEMKVETDSNPVKIYSEERAKLFDLTFPSDYKKIEG